jgi:hypothetical protein
LKKSAITTQAQAIWIDEARCHVVKAVASLGRRERCCNQEGKERKQAALMQPSHSCGTYHIAEKPTPAHWNMVPFATDVKILGLMVLEAPGMHVTKACANHKSQTDNPFKMHPKKIDQI